MEIGNTPQLQQMSVKVECMVCAFSKPKENQNKVKLGRDNGTVIATEKPNETILFSVKISMEKKN